MLPAARRAMAFTKSDRFVAWCRFRVAARHITPGASVCGLGAGEGAPFLQHIEVGSFELGIKNWLVAWEAC